jgi:hypothetical protein
MVVPCHWQLARNTHGSADGTTRNGQLDALVWRESIDAALGKEIRGALCTAQDLEQHRNVGGLKGNTINEESRAGIVLSFHVRAST